MGKRDWAEYHGLETSKLSPGKQFLTNQRIQHRISEFPAENFSRMMDIPQAKVIRFSGLQRTEEFDIDNRAVFDSEVK
jgi:hypothetical protein